jgi:aldehyde:ferredoxin oxidoreductase
MARFHTLLRIDLTARSATKEEVRPEYERLYIGGKGVGTAYLTHELEPGIDPLGVDNKIILSAGPLTGTAAPASSRFELVTKSPLTGIYLDSNSGGHFGQEIKAAGHDLIIIEGASDSPVIVGIWNDDVHFIAADDIWGLKTYNAENAVRKLLKDPDIKVLTIGPAGENLVRFALVSNDYSRNAARGGAGAVFGAKKVKAIAVRGTRDIPLKDICRFMHSVEKAKAVIFSNPWVGEHRKYGTLRNMIPINSLGLLPVDNFTKGVYGGIDKIDQYAFEKLFERKLSCGECPIACGRSYTAEAFSLEGPEYETAVMLGPNIGLDNPHDIAELNYFCNQNGVDTITVGALIGALIASHTVDVKGKNIKEIVLGLIDALTFKEGIGKILAEGLKTAGQELGIAHLIPEIKGLGLPGYDPRGSDGTALAYMTSDRGACHLRAWPLGREVAGVWEEHDLAGKILFVKNQQDDKAAEESLIVCQFPYGIGLLDEVLPEMMNEACGESWDLHKLRLAGERIWNLIRVFNCKEGISRKDDYLPDKFSSEGITEGPLKGRTIEKCKQDEMLDRYYELRGWDAEGRPVRDTLKRLNIRK